MARAMHEVGFGIPAGGSGAGLRLADPIPPMSDDDKADAVAELYREHAERILRHAVLRVKDRALAEDVVQETFVRALRAYDTFDPSRPVLPWLVTMANRAAVDLVRRRSVAPMATSAHDARGVNTDRRAPADVEPHAQLVARQRRAGIADALSSINDRQKRVLLMKEVEGLRYDDIARAEGMSVDALKSLIARARRAFRATYGELAEQRGLAAAAPIGALRWIASRARDAGRAMRVAPSAGFVAVVVAGGALLHVAASPTVELRGATASALLAREAPVAAALAAGGGSAGASAALGQPAATSAAPADGRGGRTVIERSAGVAVGDDAGVDVGLTATLTHDAVEVVGQADSTTIGYDRWAVGDLNVQCDGAVATAVCAGARTATD